MNYDRLNSAGIVILFSFLLGMNAQEMLDIGAESATILRVSGMIALSIVTGLYAINLSVDIHK